MICCEGCGEPRITRMNADDNFICPNCGAEVPANASACPECGADEKTGWSPDTIYDGTGIEDPDDDGFDYENWKRREVDGKSPRRTKWQRLVWWMALFVLIACVALFVV